MELNANKKAFTLIELLVVIAVIALQLENPDAATYWRRVEPGNTDIWKLVTAVWGHVGWTSQN